MKRTLKKFLPLVGFMLGLYFFATGKHESGMSLAFMGPMLGVVDTTRERAAYDKINQKVAMLNLLFNKNMITEIDYLRSEQVITATTVGNLTFQTWDKVMQTTIATFPLQKGVKDNDIFVAMWYALYIDNRASGATNVFPQTYVNPFHFTAANTTTANDLQSVFNAKWSFKVNTTMFVQDYSTLFNLNVPQTQQSLATNQSQFNGNSLVSIDPYIGMSGRSDNQLTLNVPTFAGWNGAGINSQNIITFFFKGLTVTNGSEYLEYINGQQSLELELEEQVRKGKIKLTDGGIYVRA